ncbi:glycosyltransferase [Candidatus Peregrinibacteria bacterium]|nr:glycosyltransferase [Candidatus Peregrinibacteria bacterium]
MNQIRFLVVNPLWPRPAHSIRAANIVLFELISELARTNGVHVTFLKINKYNDEPHPTAEDEEGIALLRKQGVDVLPVLTLPPTPPKRSALNRVLFTELSDFYPEIIFQQLAKDLILSHKPDVLFIPWTEWCTSLCADIPVLKFAYYGNPDHKSALAMTEFNYQHGTIGFFKYLAQKFFYKKLEKFHLKEIKKYEILGDVALNDAQYYIEHGHKNAFYIQNLWIDRFGEEWRQKRLTLGEEGVPVIIANIGKLGGTANTHGLEILGRDFLPALRRAMNGKKYGINLFGAGSPHPAIVKNLESPEVRMRGFVDDIDGEMLASRIFLCLNNASDYKVGHTRYLHAWSLGCCVVAHKDAALSMPEIVHGENALLGKDVDEIANLIAKALFDPQLLSKIGEGGYRTFKKYFTAASVVPEILKRIKMRL